MSCLGLGVFRFWPALLVPVAGKVRRGREGPLPVLVWGGFPDLPPLPFSQEVGVILTADVLPGLRTLPDASVQCVVTSPPYWALRDYGVEGQIGSEPTIAEYVAKMVEVFAEVHRVLKKDGVLWLNLGDTYSAGTSAERKPTKIKGPAVPTGWSTRSDKTRSQDPNLKPKDRCMIPARVAIALQDWGWYLRDEIIWHKPNPMPSSVQDRTTPAHEMVYLLSKSKRYFYDAAAIRTVFSAETKQLSHDTMDFRRRDKYSFPDGWAKGAEPHDNMGFSRRSRDPRMNVEVPDHFKGSVPGRKGSDGRDRRSKNARGNRLRADLNDNWDAAEDGGTLPVGANARSVWTIATEPFKAAHFATFPQELPRRCVLAGSRPGDVVLDPFAGSGTTLLVARRYGRKYIGIELNPEYVRLAEKRLADETPPLLEVA